MLKHKFVLFYLLLLLYNIEGKPKAIRCPEFCTCDIYFGLKRASCQYKKLISVEIDMPPQAEIFDLSHNQVTQLGNNIFLEIGLTNLKLLNISYNKLSQIHFHGFEGLSKLKTLDLSHNMLKYFLDHWWLSLSNLQELFLAGNLLRAINTEPRLKLKNLRVLDLSFCFIESLNTDIFASLPSLESLDLSRNLLIEFKVDIIKPLHRINTLNLGDNSFECGPTLPSWATALKAYTNNKGIKHYETCIMVNLSQKSQRMMVEEEPLQKNGWLYDEDIEMNENHTIIKCNVSTPPNKTENILIHQLMRVIELSPPLFVLFLVVFGFFVGVLFGCTCQIRGQYKEIDLADDVFIGGSRNVALKSKTNNNQRFNRSLSSNSGYRDRSRSTGSRRMVREDRNILLVNEYKLSDSTPVLSRKSTSNEV